jgi:hypothetical protein
MQTSLTDLKILLTNGIILLNVQSTDIPALSRKFKEKKIYFKKNLFFYLELIVQSLVDAKYIDNSDYAQKLSWILGLPHFHHHEKRSVTKTASSISLSKQGLHPSPSFIINNLSRRGMNSFFFNSYHSISLIDDDSDHTQDMSALRLVSKPSTHDMLSSSAEREETSSITHPSAKV